MIFKTGLFIHMIGIFLIAGGSIGTIITESLFWKNIKQNSEKSRALVPLLLRFPPILVTGAMLLLVSGLLMLYGLNWIYWGQTWLTIKLFLFLLIVLNGRLHGRPIFYKIAGEAQLPKPSTEKLFALKNKIRRFHIIQFFMLFAVIALVIFKL
jgi:hypothetical protein